MTTEGKNMRQAMSESLAEWRTAEQAAAVARRGRLAAQAASEAAQAAAEAAAATADAAKASLSAATSAEESASRTAVAAKLAASAAGADLADTLSEEAMADVEEARSRHEYQALSERSRADGA